MTEIEFVSVKDACNLLNCGRTKIYTHYLAKGILEIRKKVGNRSYFSKADIIEVIQKEEEENFFQPSLQPQQGSKEPEKHEASEPNQQAKEDIIITEHTSNENDNNNYHTPTTKLLLPAKATTEKDSNEILVTDYISELKQTIHNLEQTIDDQKEILHQYKEKVKDSISLLEHNNKLKLNEKLLLESKEHIQNIENRNTQLEQSKIELEKENREKNQKLNKSVQVALHIKKQLDEELEKKETLQKLQQRWKEVQNKIRECGFFDFSTKAKLKRELEQIQISIQNFS